MSENKKQIIATKRIPPCPLSYKNKQTSTSVQPSTCSGKIMVEVPLSQSKLSSPELDYSSISNCEEKPLNTKYSKIKSLIEKDESKDSQLKKKSVKQIILETASITSIKEALDELRGIEEEILESTTKTVTFKTIKWYPYENTDTVAGKMTHMYLQALTDAVRHETEVFRFLSIAKSIYKNISCEKTNMAWKKLNIIIPMCYQFVELNQVAYDIAFYLRYDPELLSAYLKCFERLKAYIKPTPEATQET